MVENNKEKFALWIRPEVKQMVEKNYQENGFRSRSEYIEKAIIFYSGYLTAEEYRECLPSIMISSMKAVIDSFENRMGHLLFKNAVEMNMMMHVLSATSEIDDEQLVRLRSMCASEVRQTRGSVTFEDAWRFQKSD